VTTAGSTGELAMAAHEALSAQPALSRLSVDLLVSVETTLEYPVETVWPYVLQWKRWVDDYIEQRIAGTANTEGEIKSISHLDATGRMQSQYFVKLIRVLTHKLLVYKILSPSYNYDASNGARSQMALSGYDVFRVRAENGRTVMNLEIYADMELQNTSETQARDFAQKHQIEAERNWYETYFPRLRLLLSQSQVS